MVCIYIKRESGLNLDELVLQSFSGCTRLRHDLFPGPPWPSRASACTDGGLLDVLRPEAVTAGKAAKPAATIWVSGAAGAVGGLVGQIAKGVFGLTARRLVLFLGGSFSSPFCFGSLLPF